LLTTKADVLQASIDAHGIPLTDEALNAAKSADAVLLGAIGGPVRVPEKWVVDMV
jgi:isocitrate/isopropylmalate dehydrogenase